MSEKTNRILILGIMAALIAGANTMIGMLKQLKDQLKKGELEK